MVVIGAGGLAKEILEILKESYKESEIFFFDNIIKNTERTLFDKYKILKTREEVLEVFAMYGDSYCIGIGGVESRLQLISYFNSIGGKLKTVTSKESFISEYVKIDTGTVVFPGVKISNNVTIGKSCLIYYNTVITHDCEIGDFVEISPSVSVLGKAKVGNNSFLGANATILPNVSIGDDSIIGAGAVVTKSVPNGVLVVGVPAKVIKKLGI
tara:strand:+ start:757 stop:1392 length:636 start_codon:yes stop_codon:yes gene_type:complete